MKALFVIAGAVIGALIGSQYNPTVGTALQIWTPTIIGTLVAAGVASFVWSMIED